MKYFLGIDVGSSKTHALIVDETGRCIGFGKAGAGNHQGVGYDGLENVLKEAFSSAQKMSGVDKAHIAGAGFGVQDTIFLLTENFIYTRSPGWDYPVLLKLSTMA